MVRIIRILDDMVREEIVDDYAIGGATALAYYSDNIFTEDIDVFVYLRSQSPVLIDLGPIYEYLVRTQNARVQGQYLVVEEFPVQFLVPYDDLSREAFARAVPVMYGDAKTKIFELEYLMAIMIQLGKQKYRERIRKLIEERAYDEQKLEQLLKTHRLHEKWLVLKKSVEGE